jgi:pimeloyl-ACP methyl ester carboxylesterase
MLGRRATAIVASTLLLVAGLASLPGAQASEPERTTTTVESFDGTEIDTLVCQPADASAEDPAPVVMHSHGWGGSRADDCSSFDALLDAGFGVVSVTQRGFGNSGGKAHVHDPALEGQDNKAVIDHVASLPWVQTEGPQDPVMGAIGGSYGGGYQFITALTEIQETGDTRLDALAPEITWYDLVQSLAPDDVIRSVWVDALYAAGATNVHQGIHEAFAYGLATGQLPDGTVPGVHDVVADFTENSPAGFVSDGVQLDVPTLMRQGLTDNLFNLNQAVDNYQRTLTADARADSYLVGYNGGHALPNAYPPGTMASGDPCSSVGDHEGFDELRLAFLENQLTGADNPMPGTAYRLATDDGGCLAVDSVEPTQTVDAGPAQVAATPSGAGAPVYLPLTEGPTTVAGVPQLDATLTTAGVDQRAFLGLAVGPSPAQAQMLSNNVLPVQRDLPVAQEDLSMELPGVATEVAEDETLYLVVSPTSDMFVHHGSRTPGTVAFEDVEVGLPVPAS